MSTKPIRRHPSLQPLSRDHHYGLLCSWKIREGFKRNIAPERIKAYADWFWTTQLQKHFEEEEKELFSILPHDHSLILQAKDDHARIRSLIEDMEDISKNLSTLEVELDKHIRFEERVLFNEIQTVATEEQLRSLERHHNTPYAEEWHDEFWKEII